MTASTTVEVAKAGKAKRPPRVTRPSVILFDKIANWTITVGGLLVIIAVAAIMLFLLQVVVPLFTGGKIESVREYRIEGIVPDVVMANVDEYKTIGFVLGRDGGMNAWHFETGKPLEAPKFDVGGGRVTSFSRTIDRANLAFGFSDGTVRFGIAALGAQIVSPDARPQNLSRLDTRDLTDGKDVYTEISDGQLRKISLSTRLDAPQQIAPAGTPIVAMDYRRGGTVERPTLSFVTADATGTIRLSRAEGRLNLMTRRMTTDVATSELPALPPGVEIKTLLLTDQADMVLVASTIGEIFRFDTRDFAAPRLAERARVMPEGERLNGLYFLIGEQSLVAVGERGSVRVYFRLPGGPETADGLRLVLAHDLESQRAAVEALAASQRGKLFLTADSGGRILLRHTTSEQTMLRFEKAGGAARYAAIALSPRDDAVFAIAADGRATAWNISVPHPETTLATIFGRVWYEGYEAPSWTWQSSAGTDQFEPKFSLVPLIFGTLKATIYAMLFAVPIAIFAAIYTSEMLDARVRSIVKPSMEMLASLPSVVLGFIAALILAPMVENIVPAVVFAVVLFPLAFIAAGHLWQLLPRPVMLRHGGLTKLGLIFVCLFVAGALADSLGGAFEKAVFGGNIKAWLNGDIGGATGFTAFLLLPISAMIVVVGGQRVFGVALDRLTAGKTRFETARAALLKWIAIVAATVALAFVAAALVTAIGFDPRGGLVGTYVQRNTLIVGFAMGFAVIPIIYTISEDALNSVPEHLRSASLACGATPWQTATRVILPTGASGVFAAVMVGMGRAVGETMIVVMAAGNTPILDWNIFNGLRALSANIAVELPEAVRDGSLYRMLFLAALTLFVMTFVVNTIAEMIRLRFRRRAASL